MKIQQAKKIIVPGERQSDLRSATLAVVERSPGKKVTVRKSTYDYGLRSQFSPPEYNLMEIGTIEDVESYVRQSFQKKTALMFKEGEKLTGKDKRTIDYLKKRIRQIEYASGIPWRTLLRETGYALVSRSNYFWVKARNQDASGGRSIGGVPPVAAYFGMGGENVEIKKDKTGKVIKYRQVMADGRKREFLPRDVVHFYAYKKPGFNFGTPQLVPVKEDIKILRRIEENIELLIYQTLFPIFQYKVGTESRPATDIRLADGTTMSEVDYVRNQIETMPTEGGIVVPERHDLKFIGAEGKALKAREYLDYFKQRVLSGLGISGVDIGEGGTANRATSDTMSKSMVDSVKDYQDIIEEVINSQVIPELLIESTFNFDVIDPMHSVSFKFKEIDIEEQMKKNTNMQVLYNGNVIDINEARDEVGLEPIAAAQESQMFVERVKIKEINAQLGGQLMLAEYNAQNKTPASSASPATKQAANQNQPTNQHGTKTGPQKSRLDAYAIRDSKLAMTTVDLRRDITNHVNNQIIDRHWINTLIGIAKKDSTSKYTASITNSFKKGFRDSKATESIDNFTYEAEEVMSVAQGFIDKYFKNFGGRVHNVIDKMVETGEPRKSISNAITESIDKIKSRADSIERTESIRAYNYGKAVGLKSLGYQSAQLVLNQDCEICKEHPVTLRLDVLSLDDVPPYHPNSLGTVGEGIKA